MSVRKRARLACLGFIAGGLKLSAVILAKVIISNLAKEACPGCQKN